MIIISDKIKKEIREKIAEPDVIAFPCTPLQKGMFITTLHNRTRYLKQKCWKLLGNVKLEDIINGWSKMVTFHSLLSSCIVNTTFGLYQVLLNPKTYSAFHQKGSIREILEKDASIGFQEGTVLSRLTVVDDSITGETFLVLTIHHCVYDGWTLGFLFQDWSDFTLKQTPQKAGDFLQYIKYHQNRDPDHINSYWKNYFRGFESTHVFSKFLSATSNESDDFHDQILKLDFDEQEIKRATKNYRTTIANIFRVAWSETLRIFCQTNDIVFGEVVSGRDINLESIERYSERKC